MKKYILSLLVALLAGISTQAWGQLKPPPPVNPTITNIWASLPDIDTGVFAAASFTLGSRIYVVTGDTSSQFSRPKHSNRLWMYDTVTKVWTRKADFPGKPRLGAAAGGQGSIGFVGGGRKIFHPVKLMIRVRRNAAPQDTVIITKFRYDNSALYQIGFSRIDSFPSGYDDVYLVKDTANTNQVLTLDADLYQFNRYPANYYNYKVLDRFKIPYHTYRGDSVLNDLWTYSAILDKWTREKDIPGSRMGRAYPIGTFFNGKIYIGLGYDNDSIKFVSHTENRKVFKWLDSIEVTLISQGPPAVYKIDTIWRYDTVVVNTVTIFDDSIRMLKDLWEYEISGGGVWTQKANFPGAKRSNAFCIRLDTAILVGLGRDSIPNNFYDDVYAYTPSSNKWSQLSTFPASKRHSVGAFGLGFLGYVVGGDDGLPRRDFYEYNLISNSWDRLPDFPDSTRSLGVSGNSGKMGYFGFGGGLNKIYDDWNKWIIDTNRVTITSIPSGPFCGGETITVGYKIPSGITLGSGNVFTVQISDSLGSFFFPVDCGTFTSTNATGTFNVTIPSTTLEGNSYKFRIVASEPKMTGTPTMTSFSIRQLPSIAGGPYAQSSCLKADAMFIVNAGGTNLTYQWRKGGVPISDGAKYTGTTNDSLIIKSTVLGDAGIFDVVISGTCNPPAMSPPATLTIQNIPPATITLQPLTDTICEGDSAKFKVAATGTAVNYRWLRGLDTLNNKDTVRNSPFVLGATTNELTITPTRLSDSGWYRCLVFENCGSKTYSDPIYLGFYLNTEIIDQPTNVDTVEFVNIGFKVSARGENLKYEWYKGSTKLSNGAKYDGADSDSLTVKNLQMGDVGFYQCYVTGDCGTVKKSLLGLLEIDPMPVIDEQPINTSDCEKSTVFFSVKVTGANIVYKWRKGGIPLVNGGKISGADLRTLVISDIDASDNGTYDCEVSTGPYTKVISAGGTLVVKPTPPKPVISSFGPDFIQSSTNGDIYRWYIDNVFEPSITVQTPKVTVIGDYRVRVTKDGCISELSDPYFWFPTTGIANINAGSLNLYPNPASNNVEVEIPSAITAGTVKVYDMLGKVVIEKDFTSSGNFALNIAQLREGMYVVAVVSENNSYVGRLVKQ